MTMLARQAVYAACVLAGIAPRLAADVPARAHQVMPAPAHLEFGAGRLPIGSDLRVAVIGHDDARLRAAIGRALRRWEQRTTYCWARTPQGEFVVDAQPAAGALVIECERASPAIPSLGEPERYTLLVTTREARLRAPTVLGVLRGLETLLQLLECDRDGWYLPAVMISDSPRFPWRGLMLDPARHWMPPEVIKRNLDAMAVVKLNVLHLHLTDDQGFRIESQRHPRLHELGSDGDYYTQAEIRELVRYAADRGIRVVPEFDMPAHATSWLVAYPELASAPGPYLLERRRGLCDPVLDPTNEQTYALIEDIVAEMTSLFPDRYFHIGGDENSGAHWNANREIQAFIASRGLRDNAGLQAYFDRRVRGLLEQHGRKMMGWDEILHPEMTNGGVIQSWRGRAGVVTAARAGFPVVLSHGYYLDAARSAADYYANDPLPATAPLTPAEQALVIGGEAAMWSEWVTAEGVDSRIWPRTAAIAERLWSPRDADDPRDMYRRLAVVSRRLEEAGARHRVNQPAMVRRLVGDAVSPAQLQDLLALVDLVESYGLGARKRVQPENRIFTPLVRLADCAAMESDAGREFSERVDAFVYEARGQDPKFAAELARVFDDWERCAGTTAAAAIPSPAAQDFAVVAAAITDAVRIGREALGFLGRGVAPDGSWLDARRQGLSRHAEPNAAAVNLPFLAPVRRLAAAASLVASRDAMTREEWRATVTSRSAAPSR